MQDETEIAALEHRIAAAFDRIGRGIDRIAAAPAPAAVADDSDLREALEVEREVNAQLTERLRAVKEREAQLRHKLEERVSDLVRQLDVQGIELQRLKKTTIQLRETLRAQTDAMSDATGEAHLINRAMLAELEALRAMRLTEASEMEAILSELAPLIEAPDGPLPEEEHADA